MFYTEFADSRSRQAAEVEALGSHSAKLTDWSLILAGFAALPCQVPSISSKALPSSHLPCPGAFTCCPRSALSLLLLLSVLEPPGKLSFTASVPCLGNGKNGCSCWVLSGWGGMRGQQGFIPSRTLAIAALRSEFQLGRYQGVCWKCVTEPRESLAQVWFKEPLFPFQPWHYSLPGCTRLFE